MKRRPRPIHEDRHIVVVPRRKPSDVPLPEELRHDHLKTVLKKEQRGGR